jgi:hypothetical protein
MRSLILCQACKRHIRSNEQHCPFCGAEAAAPEAADGERRARGRAGGRAALFLAGTVVAGASAACEDDSDNESNLVPVYGSPIDDDDGDDDTASDAGRADGGKDAGPPLPVPVYGIPIDRDAGSSPVRDASIGDAATNPRDADLAVPVYGVPIDPRDSGAAACEAGALAKPARPLVDGGASDAGSACAAPEDAGRDSGRPLIAPVYGIPVDPGVGPRPKR